MKKIYTLVVVAMMANIATAGNRLNPTPQESRDKANAYQQAHQSKLSGNSKTNAVVYRTIGDKYEYADTTAWIGDDSNTHAFNTAAYETQFTNYDFDNTTTEWYGTTRHTKTVRAGSGVVDEDSVVVWLRATSTWRNYEKYTHTFTTNDLYSSETRQVWDTINNEWVNKDKNDFTYDANNNLTLVVQQTWNAGITQWKNAASEENTYNTGNKVLTSIKKNWDATQLAFRNSSRAVYTYNTDNLETEYTFQNWDTVGSLQWMNASHRLRTYNGTHSESIIRQSWDGTAWANYQRQLYGFTNNMFTYFEQDSWNTSGSAWEPIGNFGLAYNGAGYEILHSDSSWDAVANAFYHTAKTETSYNADNDKTLENSYEWDGTTYSQPSKTYYTYDTNRNLTFVNSEYYDNTALTYVPNDRHYYYYQSFTVSGIEETAAVSNIGVYPNPSGGSKVSTKFSLLKDSKVIINIYDNNGKLISTQTNNFGSGENTVQLNVNGLANGMYHVQYINASDNSTASLKLLVQ